MASQYQEELPPVRPIVRRFDIEVSHCSQCRRRVQGRHRLQTSDALGAAGVQLGPGVVALVVELHTEMGVPLAKVARVLRTTFGVDVTEGGLARMLHRAARDAATAYQELCRQVRNAPVVTPDETGWRVGGKRHWLWAYATPETTVYAICPGRGFDDAATVLGIDYAGVLVRDGWVVYRRCRQAPRRMPPLRHKLFSCNMLSSYLSIQVPIPCTIRAWTGPDRFNWPWTHRPPRRHDGSADSSRNCRRLEMGCAGLIRDLMAADDDEAAIAGAFNGEIPVTSGRPSPTVQVAVDVHGVLRHPPQRYVGEDEQRVGVADGCRVLLVEAGGRQFRARVDVVVPGDQQPLTRPAGDVQPQSAVVVPSVDVGDVAEAD